MLDFISYWRIFSTSLSGQLQTTFDAFSNGILLRIVQLYPLLDLLILDILFQLPLAIELIFHSNSEIFKTFLWDMFHRPRPSHSLLSLENYLM